MILQKMKGTARDRPHANGDQDSALYNPRLTPVLNWPRSAPGIMVRFRTTTTSAANLQRHDLQTQNDSEVAAADITSRRTKGMYSAKL